MLEDLRFRLRALIWRGSVERDLDEELRLHLERQTAAFVAAGLTEEEAARRARDSNLAGSSRSRRIAATLEAPGRSKTSGRTFALAPESWPRTAGSPHQ